jgi:diacylglycerol kinase (ATP)
VANARTAAGGFAVAPTASPEDGRLDVVLIHAGDTLDLSVVAARLMHGDYTHDENVIHRRVRTVAIGSDPPLPMSLDGERCECARVAFTVVPKAIRVLAGPDYTPRPATEPPVEADDELETNVTAPDPGVAARLFGLLAAVLLLAKRTPGWAALGLGVAVLSAVLFAWIARSATASEWREWDRSVLQAQYDAATPALDRLAVAATWPGDAGGTTLISVGLLAVFLWRKHYLTAAAFGAVVGGVVVLEFVLKPAFGSARPDLFPRTVEAAGYSFPSGHALRGVGLFGFLTALCVARGWERRRYGWWLLAVACVGLAFGVCWSRVYLGVHWPTDVIAGALAAAAWVAACLVARSYAMTRVRKKRVGGTGRGAVPVS